MRNDQPDDSSSAYGEFPRLEAAAPAVLTRPHTQRTWVGSSEDMAAVQRYVEDELAKVYAQEVEKLNLPDSA